MRSILKEKILHNHYNDLYGHALASSETPAPGVMIFTNLVNPSFGIITIYLVCIIYAWE